MPVGALLCRLWSSSDLWDGRLCGVLLARFAVSPRKPPGFCIHRDERLSAGWHGVNGFMAWLTDRSEVFRTFLPRPSVVHMMRLEPLRRLFAHRADVPRPLEYAFALLLPLWRTHIPIIPSSPFVHAILPPAPEVYEPPAHRTARFWSLLRGSGGWFLVRWHPLSPCIYPRPFPLPFPRPRAYIPLRW